MATKKITLNEIKKLIQKEIHRQFLNENELDELFFSSGTPPTGPKRDDIIKLITDRGEIIVKALGVVDGKFNKAYAIKFIQDPVWNQTNIDKIVSRTLTKGTNTGFPRKVDIQKIYLNDKPVNSLELW